MFQPPGHQGQDELQGLGETCFSELKENTSAQRESSFGGAGSPTCPRPRGQCTARGWFCRPGGSLAVFSFLFFLSVAILKFPWKVKKEKIIF